MKHLFTLLSLLTISSLASAQAEQRIKQYNLASTSLAISGYDPVAYFTQRKAVEGLKAHTLVHDGVTYRFASQHAILRFIWAGRCTNSHLSPTFLNINTSAFTAENSITCLDSQ